jgi:hypothetical protein
MKWPKRTYLFLEVDIWEWKCQKHIPVLVVVNLPPIVLQVVVLLSSVLMNGIIAEVYASRMMLLLTPVSTSALSRCSSLLTMRLTTNSVVGWDDFGSLVLLLLNGLEEVNKYSFSSPSSLLVDKLISVERRQGGFSLPCSLLTACSLFRLQLKLPFECINCLLIALISSKSKAKDFFLGPALASKKAFSCCLILTKLLLRSCLATKEQKMKIHYVNNEASNTDSFLRFARPITIAKYVET